MCIFFEVWCYPGEVSKGQAPTVVEAVRGMLPPPNVTAVVVVVGACWGVPAAADVSADMAAAAPRRWWRLWRDRDRDDDDEDPPPPLPLASDDDDEFKA